MVAETPLGQVVLLDIHVEQVSAHHEPQPELSLDLLAEPDGLLEPVVM
jgi:hypothetical protein